MWSIDLPASWAWKLQIFCGEVGARDDPGQGQTKPRPANRTGLCTEGGTQSPLRLLRPRDQIAL